MIRKTALILAGLAGVAASASAELKGLDSNYTKWNWYQGPVNTTPKITSTHSPRPGSGDNAVLFGPGAGFAIPDNSPAGVSSSINVASSFSVGSISVTLTNLTHTWVGDLIATITAPDLTSFSLFTRIGSTTATGVGDSSNFGGTYTLSNSGATTLYTEAAVSADTNYILRSGTYRTTGATAGVPSGTATDFDAWVNGKNSFGNWTLSISDNVGADTGTLGSWSLDLVPIPAPGSAALLGLAGLAAARRRRA